MSKPGTPIGYHHHDDDAEFFGLQGEMHDDFGSDTTPC